MAEAYDLAVAEGERPYNPLYERPAIVSMVRLAQQKQIQGASLRVADLSWPLGFLADESLDLAVASLVMHSLHDWVAPLRELRCVLRPNGQLIFSAHHRAQDVEPSSSGDYFDTELLHEQWNLDGKAFDVHFWRRPLTDMFAAFEQAGFTVLTLLEPQPLPEFREKCSHVPLRGQEVCRT